MSGAPVRTRTAAGGGGGALGTAPFAPSPRAGGERVSFTPSGARAVAEHPLLPVPVLAIFGVFFVESAVLGNWIPRIPEVKAALGLSDATLGLCLLAMPFGSLAGLVVAGRVVEWLGLRDACRVVLPLWAFLFTLPAFVGSAQALAAALFVAGISIALVEVAMNTEADVIERAAGRRIMSRCHGFWSLGSMAGALVGSVFAHAGVALATHFSIVMPVLAVAGFACASWLPPDVSSSSGRPTASSGASPAPTTASGGAGVGIVEAADRAPLFRLPSRVIVALCAMPLGIMVVEGAFIDWSAVFMRSVLDASPLVIGTAYAFFSVVMAAMRLSGDAIADRVGDLAVVRASGFAATIGVGLFALAPNVPVAYLGAALAGAGVAIVYPLAVSAVARRPGRSAADNVAALTMISFSAFLLAPPLIGFVSEALGLRTALALLAPLAFTTVLLSDEVVRDAPPRPA